MKKILTVLLALVVSLVSLSKELRVGVTPVPHTDILENIREDLKKEGIELKIVEFNDYVVPNLALADGEIDVNYFQHLPYLKKFATEKRLNLSSLGTIHIAPLGLYSNKYKSLDKLPKAPVLALPNDPTNLGRSLILLHQRGLLKLKNPNDWNSTEFDVIENPRNFKFKPIEASQLTRVLKDVDLAVIPGNFALAAKINPTKDSLVREDKDSPYANVIAVRAGDEKRADVKKLFELLRSEKSRKYINENFDGGVIPAF